VLAVESGAGFEHLPNMLNVIDLGGGNAGVIFSEHGDDSASISLVEYHDGMDLSHMRTLQSIARVNDLVVKMLLRELVGENPYYTRWQVNSGLTLNTC
jgi:hypothetical protein